MSRLGFKSVCCPLFATLVSLTFVSRAAATCGDYLQMNDHGQAPQTNQANMPVPAEMPCPCRGEECRGAPLAPPAPQAPQRTGSQQDGNLPTLDDQSLALRESGARHFLSARPDRGYPLVLNRPPDELV